MKFEEIIKELYLLLNKSERRNDIELSLNLKIDKKKNINYKEIEEIELNQKSEYEKEIKNKKMDDIKFSLALSPILEEFPEIKLDKGNDIEVGFLEETKKIPNKRYEFIVEQKNGNAFIYEIFGLKKKRIANTKEFLFKEDYIATFKGTIFTGGLKDLIYLKIKNKTYIIKKKRFSLSKILKYEKDWDKAIIIAAGGLFKKNALFVKDLKNKRTVYKDISIFNINFMKQMKDYFYYDLLKFYLINMLLFSPRTGDLLEFFKTLDDTFDLSEYPVKITNKIKKMMNSKNYEEYEDGVYTTMGKVFYIAFEKNIPLLILKKGFEKIKLDGKIDKGDYIIKTERIENNLVVSIVMVKNKNIEEHIKMIDNFLNNSKKQFFIGGYATYSVINKNKYKKIILFESKCLV